MQITAVGLSRWLGRFLAVVQLVPLLSVWEGCSALEPIHIVSGEQASLRNSGSLQPTRLARGGERTGWPWASWHAPFKSSLRIQCTLEAHGSVQLSNQWGPMSAMFAFTHLLATMFHKRPKSPVTHVLYKLPSAKSWAAQLPQAVFLLQWPFPSQGPQVTLNFQFHLGSFLPALFLLQRFGLNTVSRIPIWAERRQSSLSLEPNEIRHSFIKQKVLFRPLESSFHWEAKV